VSKEIPGVFHDDPKMSASDIEQVDILSESTCSNKWIEYVSAVNRHFMQMQDDEWPAKVVADSNFWYRWQEEWNDDDFCKFSSLLRDVSLPGNSTLYVFWMKEVGVKTTWEVFCNNWGNFLYEDEGCILVLPAHEVSLVLSNGSAWQGERGAAKT
jgi:hypothetical protein